MGNNLKKNIAVEENKLRMLQGKNIFRERKKIQVAYSDKKRKKRKFFKSKQKLAVTRGY